MKWSVVGSLLMLILAFGFATGHAIRVQTSVEEDAAEERDAELYRTTASKRSHDRRKLSTRAALARIFFDFRAQPSMLFTPQAPALLIDPHRPLQVLRI